MRRITLRIRWILLHVLRPYLCNSLCDKRKWFITQMLNRTPAPGDYLRPRDGRWFRTRYGSRMHGDKSNGADRFMYFTGEYEPATSRLVAQIIGPGWRFIDIGANVGFYTLLASRRADEVVSLEPNPVTRRRLLQNLSLNDEAGVSVLPYALSDKNERATLYQVGDDHGGASMLVPEGSVHEYPIEARRDDDIVASTGDGRTFIKVDVEGSEYRVLSGWHSVLSGTGVVVLVEIADTW